MKESFCIPSLPRTNCSPIRPSTSKISSRLIPHLWSLNDHKVIITGTGQSHSPTLCCCFQALLSVLTYHVRTIFTRMLFLPALLWFVQFKLLNIQFTPHKSIPGFCKFESLTLKLAFPRKWARKKTLCCPSVV